MGDGEKAGNPLWSRRGTGLEVWVTMLPVCPTHLGGLAHAPPSSVPPLQRAGSTADPLAVSLKEGHGGRAVQEEASTSSTHLSLLFAFPSLWQRDTGGSKS